MKRKLRFHHVVLIAFLWPAAQACTSVKPYQKQYLNDAEMELSVRKVQKFEINFHAYREGASGASGGKTGGCGCN